MTKIKKIYNGKILDFSVHHVTIKGRKVKREKVEHNGAAAVLGFDEKDDVILVKQYRYPHGDILEIPAGTIEKSEKPIDCAYREMIEETGYKAKKMTRLLSFYPSVGYNTEVIHCYVATGLKKIGEIDPDNDEFISVVKMSLKRLLSMIKKGEIVDAKTICTVLTFAAKKKLL